MGFRDLYTLQGTFWVPQGLGEGVSGAVAPPIPEEFFTNKITNLPSPFYRTFLTRLLLPIKEKESFEAEN